MCLKSKDKKTILNNISTSGSTEKWRVASMCLKSKDKKTILNNISTSGSTEKAISH
jgi:hypothetical protein